MSRPKNVKITSPVGTILFSNLTKPSDKFKKDGEYSCKMVLDTTDPATQAFIAQVQAAAKKYSVECIARDKKFTKYKIGPEFVANTDEDGNDIPNTVVINARRQASGHKKNPDGTQGERWQYRVGIWDSKGAKFPPSKNIGRGTTARLSLELSPFIVDGQKTLGVSLRLCDAQIIKFVEYVGGSFESTGFDAVEGGFDATTDAATETAPFSSENTEGTGEGSEETSGQAF